jgi:hypothetical protein
MNTVAPIPPACGDNSIPDPLETLNTAKQLAKRLGIAVRAIWRLDSAGKLPTQIRIGGAPACVWPISCLAIVPCNRHNGSTRLNSA